MIFNNTFYLRISYYKTRMDITWMSIEGTKVRRYEGTKVRRHLRIKVDEVPCIIFVFDYR